MWYIALAATNVVRTRVGIKRDFRKELQNNATATYAEAYKMFRAWLRLINKTSSPSFFLSLFFFPRKDIDIFRVNMCEANNNCFHIMQGRTGYRSKAGINI